MIMKKRVKILASALLLLGFISLSTETSKAAVICFNIIDFGAGSYAMHRCTPGPEGCVSIMADEAWLPSNCDWIKE